MAIRQLAKSDLADTSKEQETLLQKSNFQDNQRSLIVNHNLQSETLSPLSNDGKENEIETNLFLGAALKPPDNKVTHLSLKCH